MIKTAFITGMHCEHCVKAVNDALKAVDGVTSVDVSLENSCATIMGNNLDDAALKAAIEDTGFDVLEIA